MEIFKILTICIVFFLSTSNGANPVTVARTELKVSRSLDPSAVQTVSVITKDGSVAQLIVKKRDGKSQSTTTAPVTQSTKESNFTEDTIQSNWIPLPSVQANNENTDIFINTDTRIGNQISGDESKNTYFSVPKPVTIQSESVYVKNQAEDSKRGRSITQLGSDGIPVVHGVRVPDDETDAKVWRNARVINGELVPYERGYMPQPAIPVGQLVFASKTPHIQDNMEGFGPFTTADNYAMNSQLSSSISPLSASENRDMVTHYQEEYVGNKNNYVRFNPDGGVGPFTKADNARITDSKLIDYIKQINERESKRDYFTSRKYNNAGQGNHQIQRRMLHYGGTHTYPTSLLYTPTSTKMSRVNFNDGVRTPVLQYAHPELGVQPAKVSAEETNDLKYTKEQNNIAFPKNEYNTRPPYIVESSSAPTDYTDSGRNSQNKYYDNRNYYRKEISYHPYNPPYYRVRAPELPFWMKITESIRDNLQHGIARMQQFTRPVLDPIVEATQKIGHNLGLTPLPPNLSDAQEKVGVAAPVLGTSVILPALGLVAGGAALGLGAAAVGRFLDVGNSRSQENSYIDDLEMQHKRALDTYNNNEDIILVMETNDESKEKSVEENVGNNSNLQRRKRSSSKKVYEDDAYLERMLQNVEYEVETSILGSHLAGSEKWANTPCAKRMFCDVMTAQPYEAVAFMEKKIDLLLRTVHPVLVNNVSHHLFEVMRAVKRHDCSQFICSTSSAPRK